MSTNYKLPNRTINEGSVLYRFQKFFYRSGDPFDTCEFNTRLLKILFWILLVLTFTVAPVVCYIINWYTTGNFLVLDGHGLWHVASKLGWIETLVCVILLVVWGCFKINDKAPGVIKALGYGCLTLLVCLAMFFWISVICGESIFSGRSNLWFMTASYIGMYATLGGLVYLAISGSMKLFDSDTYATLKASAKKRWCARLRIVDENGKTRDECEAERQEANRRH